MWISNMKCGPNLKKWVKMGTFLFINMVPCVVRAVFADWTVTNRIILLLTPVSPAEATVLNESKLDSLPYSGPSTDLFQSVIPVQHHGRQLGCTCQLGHNLKTVRLHITKDLICPAEALSLYMIPGENPAWHSGLLKDNNVQPHHIWYHLSGLNCPLAKPVSLWRFFFLPPWVLRVLR